MVAATESTRAAAYAQLKAGELKLHGIAADTDAWPGLTDPADLKGAGLVDWNAVETRWQQSIGALADEVRAGHAAVRPRSVPTTCNRCGLQALCRIGGVALDANAEINDE